MREIQQEIQKYDIPIIIPEQQGDIAQYRNTLLELRDNLFGTVNKINNLADNSDNNIAANELTEKESAEFNKSKHHLQLRLLKVCITLLEIDDEFPRVLQKTEKYLTSLETIISPYYNYYNNSLKPEPLDLYYQRLKIYLAELEQYEDMIQAGAESPGDNHTALSMAFFIKNIFDIETASESDITDYFTSLKRLEKFEDAQLNYLDKIIQLKIKINDLLNPSSVITLEKVLREQRKDPPVKKILITVSFSKKEETYRIACHNTGGHMLAILFDGDKPPLCISRLPIRNEKAKKYYNYQGNLTIKEKSGLFAFLVKLARLPHQIYSAINVAYEHEIKLQTKEKRRILPPIVFYCTDEIGIDFDKALIQATKEQQDPLTLDFEDNCAEPIRRIIEAGISERNLELDSSTLMGITVPITLYENLKKLHDEIQTERNIVAKKSFIQEQKQLESTSCLTKIDELKLNIKNAKDALSIIANSIQQLVRNIEPDQLDTLSLIEYYFEQLDSILPRLNNEHDWKPFNAGKLYSDIKSAVVLEQKRCKDLLMRLNQNKGNPISAEKFENVSIKELLKLFIINNIKIPLYFDAVLITLTELLKTLPTPYNAHLEHIREKITTQLPAPPTSSLELPLQIEARALDALKPLTRNDGQPNLLCNSLQLQNVILNIQYKQAKLSERKSNLMKKIVSGNALDESLLKKLDEAISYCKKSAEILQNAYGKINEYLYFDNFDLVARKGQPNPFSALKKIFPSNNPYHHLQNIFDESANIFYNRTVMKPFFWQFWNKYEYKKHRISLYLKNSFEPEQMSPKNYKALKKKLHKLRPTLWDQLWLSDTTLYQRKKYYNELTDKTYLLYCLKAFSQGELSAAELILQLKSLANKSVSIYKNNITELQQNLSETYQFYKQQSDVEQVNLHERNALKIQTSTTALLLKCLSPDLNKLLNNGILAKTIQEIYTISEQVNPTPTSTNQDNNKSQVNFADTIQLSENFEERLYSIRSTYLAG